MMTYSDSSAPRQEVIPDGELVAAVKGAAKTHELPAKQAVRRYVPKPGKIYECPRDKRPALLADLRALILLDNGYLPILAQGKFPAGKAWQAAEITPATLAVRRQAHPAAANIGLLTGALVGIDIDARDPDHLQEFIALVHAELGATDLHRHGAKGELLCYRSPAPLGKITISCEQGNKRVPLVEFLGRGQQFIAFGRHPDGVMYRWVENDPDIEVISEHTPLTVPFADLPEANGEALRALATKVAALAETLGYDDVRLSGCNEKGASLSPYAGAPITDEVLIEALSLCQDGKPVFDPNSDYTTWRDIVAPAGNAHVIGKLSGLEIACAWSRGDYHRALYPAGVSGYVKPDSAGRVGDDAVAFVVDTMPPKKGGRNIGSIIHEARAAGWKGNPHDEGKPAAETFKDAKLQFNAPVLNSSTQPILRDPDELGLTGERLSKFKWPDMGANGVIKPTAANTRVALERLGFECRYDVFHHRPIIGGHALREGLTELNDPLSLMLRMYIHKIFGFEPKREQMDDAMKQLCYGNRFNPVLDYLDALTWDGTQRLETWLIDHAGAEDTPFVRAVSKLSLIAAVRRARQPGCKFDEIIVLESPEGMNKSSLIRVMAGEENFSDQTILNQDERRQQEHLKGKWLYEIADLSGIKSAEIEKVKAFASRQIDRCRAVWDKFEFDQKRQCVLFATTNDDAYLQSQTGNRRWWPIKVTKIIDLKRLAAERNQLWAEAAQKEAAGMSIRLAEELWPIAAEEQEKRRIIHPWEDKLCNVKGHPVPDSSGITSQHEERIFSAEIMDRYLRIDAAQQTVWTWKQVKQIMGRLGWEYHPGKLRIGADTGKGYSRIVDGPMPEPAAVRYDPKLGMTEER